MSARIALSGRKLPPVALSAGAATTLLDGTEVWSTTQSKVLVATGGVFAAFASGGAGSSATQVEVDFGTLPVDSKRFIITDAAVNASSKITAVQSGKTATGRVGDDGQWDALICSAFPEAGSFVLSVHAIPGPIVGKRYVHYQVF